MTSWFGSVLSFPSAPDTQAGRLASDVSSGSSGANFGHPTAQPPGDNAYEIGDDSNYEVIDMEHAVDDLAENWEKINLNELWEEIDPNELFVAPEFYLRHDVKIEDEILLVYFPAKTGDGRPRCHVCGRVVGLCSLVCFGNKLRQREAATTTACVTYVQEQKQTQVKMENKKEDKPGSNDEAHSSATPLRSMEGEAADIEVAEFEKLIAAEEGRAQ